MREFTRRLMVLTPALALASGGAAAASGGEARALSLEVIEEGESVEIQLVANSPMTQQVDYEIELITNSTARHAGSTSIAAGNRHVLSTLKSSVSPNWCARAKVSESGGSRYTLEAGDCPLA